MENLILMPRLGVNDDFVILAEWLVEDGQEVSQGQKIAIIETSKETNEIIAEYSGYIQLSCSSGDEIKVGDQVAAISDVQKFDIVSSGHKDKYVELRITDKAKRLIEQYHIDISLLPRNKLIKEKDVQSLILEPYEIAESKSNKLIIYGGGGFGRIAIDIINQTPGLYAYGVIDSNYPNKKETLGVPVIGDDEYLYKVFDDGYISAVNCVGFLRGNHWRKPTYELLKEYGFLFPNIIHSSANIEKTVQIGEGNLICAGAIIGSEAVIGNNCIINAGCIISHNCIISDHCHVTSGATLAGGVIVGVNTLIGMNCTVYFGVKIGKNVVIQNGCHIFRDVPDNTVVAGKK